MAKKEIITLSHYYDHFAQTQGFKDWNTYFACVPEHIRDGIKKELKQHFKSKILNKQRQADYRAKQKEQKNARKTNTNKKTS